MRRSHSAAYLVALVLGLHLIASAAVGQEFHTIMMEGTFAIVGPSGTDSLRVGTGFAIGRPSLRDSNRTLIVLVTAAHVFRGIQGDTAVLVGRVRRTDGSFMRHPVNLPIRREGRPLWVQHPDSSVDVAAILFPGHDRSLWLPDPYPAVDMLADDDTLRKIELHPGDPLFVLGYPYGVPSTSPGFAVLRSAFISSYPLLPTWESKQFLVDMPVYKGNSGGPAYLYEGNRYYKRTFHMGTRTALILGLLTEARVDKTTGKTIELAVIVPAPFIRQTVELVVEPGD